MDFKKLMVIDPQQAGISGDMVLGALISLGANKKLVSQTIEKIPNYLRNCEKIKLEVKETTRGEIRGIRVKIKTEEKFTFRKGGELKEATKKFLDESNFSNKTKNFVLDCLLTLLKAEAKIHGSTIEDLRLHETGSADTLADILGVAVALEDLKVFEDFEVYSLPVCVGGGNIQTTHGPLSIPTPATLEILTQKKFPFKGTNIEEELATPTGVSILTCLAKPINHFPLMKGIRIGYGAGEKNFEFLPNILRIVVGKPLNKFFEDEIYIIETNLDDVDGEVVGYLIEKLFKEGAKDVFVTPCIGKKGRPMFVVKTITSMEKMEKMVNLIFDETGTLGVRVYPCKRFILYREIQPYILNINGKTFKIKVKIAKDPTGKIIQTKPEFEDLKKIASETGKSLREIVKTVKKFIQQSS